MIVSREVANSRSFFFLAGTVELFQLNILNRERKNTKELITLIKMMLYFPWKLGNFFHGLRHDL